MDAQPAQATISVNLRICSRVMVSPFIGGAAGPPADPPAERHRFSLHPSTRDEVAAWSVEMAFSWLAPESLETNSRPFQFFLRRSERI